MKHVIIIIVIVFATLSAQAQHIRIDTAANGNTYYTNFVPDTTTSIRPEVILPPSVYFNRAANCRIAAMVTTGVTAAMCGAITASNPTFSTDQVNAVAVFGIAGGLTALILEIAAVVNDKKAAKALGRIAIEQNGISIQF